jgi:hypothetical protein
VDGPVEPCAEPVADPIPDAEPEAEPLALGPVVPHAANVKAHVKGISHFFMDYSFIVKQQKTLLPLLTLPFSNGSYVATRKM